MSFVSNLFILFVIISVVLYYIVPRNHRWGVLLFISYVYYMLAGPQYVLYLLFSTAVTYVSAMLIGTEVEKKRDKSKNGKSKDRQKCFLVAGLVLNFGMLGVLKYMGFVFENINALFGTGLPGMRFLLPLGISFYTFQSSGYLLDVYWKRVRPEKNVLRYALFVSFFPQLLQGPIGRYSRLAQQLYTGHSFCLSRIRFGCERILWGYFKKLVLADWAAVFVDAVFLQPDTYQGLSLLGVLFYSVQLYADFSGGMDVALGVAQLFGIELDENFKRPYFAVSLTDFWHRWHITLGTWMKDYVFYPLSLSQRMRRLGDACGRRLGKRTGRKIPICIANLIVFFLVGIWHGAQWKFVAYGLYNGLIIAASGLLADTFKTWKKKVRVDEKNLLWKLFCILRTFVIVNISWFFDCTETVGDAFRMMGSALTKWEPSVLLSIPAGREGTAFTPYALLIICGGSLLVLAVSLLQERGIRIRESIAKRPVFVEIGLYTLLLLSIGFFGSSAAVRGFIYAQF